MFAVVTSADVPHIVRERRRTPRYPIDEEVHYRIPAGKTIFGDSGNRIICGAGKTINIGSAGILFTAEDPLPVGLNLELSISWPALLDGACHLKLVATATVVRTEGCTVGARILHYEFRTRASRQ